MALFQILFGSQLAKGFCPENKDGTVALGLELDAVVSESPSYKATLTKHPVENGAKIADHVMLEPLTLDLDGVVTSTPAAALGLLRGIISPNVVADAHEHMKRLWKTREPFTFVGSLDVYENMIMTSYNPSRNSKNSDALEFHCSLENINVVYSKEVPAVNFKKQGKGASALSNRGSQSTSTAPSKLDDNASSILAKRHPGLWKKTWQPL